MQKLSFVIGADWNMEAAVLESMAIVDSLQAAILADRDAIGTGTPEGGVSCIDYFLMSGDLAEAAQSGTVIPNAPIAPYKLVVLELGADAADLKGLIAVAMQRVPPAPIFSGHARSPLTGRSAALAKVTLKAAQKERQPAGLTHATTDAYKA